LEEEIYKEYKEVEISLEDEIPALDSEKLVLKKTA